MISVTTNTAALIAKRNLSENSLQATRSIAKVSQGTRVVKPMDDAASLAISNTMRTSLAGMTQGIRNTTQGSSLLQVAAGGLEQTSQMLTRMKQLAVQVINDTLGSAEISYANEEFGQLMQQIDSTAEQTRFSGKSLLTGGSSNVSYTNRLNSADVPNLNNIINPALNPTGVDTSAFKTVILDAFDHNANVNKVAVIPSASSSGFVNHTFSSNPQDIEMEAFDGVFGRSLRLNVGGEYFSGLIHNLRPDGEIVLTSENDPANVIGFDLANDVSTIAAEPDFLLHFREFLTGAKINIGQSKVIMPATRNTNVGNFNFEDLIDPSVTYGTIQNFVLAFDDISVTGTDDDMTIIMDVAGETFQAKNVNPATGETLILKSMTNSGNQFGLRYTQNAAGPTDIDTVTEMEDFLRRYFSTGSVIGGPQALTYSVGWSDTNRFMEGRVGGSLNIGGTQNMQATNQSVTGPDGGPYDARIVIGSQTFRAQIEDGTNIANTDIRFVSTSNLNNVVNIFARTNFPNRADLETELTGFTSDLEFQRDGGIFDVGDPERTVADYSDSLSNGFAGFNNVYSKGFIDGIAKSVEVSGSNNGPFNISLIVGDQTFVQHGFDPNRSDNLILTSENDPENVISYTVGPGDAREHLDSLDEIRVSLESLFGLNKFETHPPTAFESASGANHGYNGISMGNNKSILAGVATPPGKYAISYDSDTRIAKLTNGVSVFKEIIDPNDVIDGKTTISFGNGVTLKLGDDNNKFNIDSSISQMIFEVNQDDIVQLEFQTSDVSEDDMRINMTPATVEALRLTGSNISDKDLAREAQDKIDLAITSINTGLANIGAQQSRFEFVRVNLTIQMENTTASRATYYDVDMGGEITDFTKYQTLTQAATSMLSQANKMPQELMRLLP